MRPIQKQRARVSRVAASAVTLTALAAVASAPAALAQHPTRTPATPASGGTISYRDGNIPTCVDPLIAPTSAEGLADYPTFDNLVLLDGRGNARPDLATSWSFSHGGRWVHLKIVESCVREPATAVAWQTSADCGRVSPCDVTLRRVRPGAAVPVVCHATAVAGRVPLFRGAPRRANRGRGAAHGGRAPDRHAAPPGARPAPAPPRPRRTARRRLLCPLRRYRLEAPLDLLQQMEDEIRREVG